jgi:hypothetical protein
MSDVTIGDINTNQNMRNIIIVGVGSELIDTIYPNGGPEDFLDYYTIKNYMNADNGAKTLFASILTKQTNVYITSLSTSSEQKKKATRSVIKFHVKKLLETLQVSKDTPDDREDAITTSTTYDSKVRNEIRLAEGTNYPVQEQKNLNLTQTRPVGQVQGLLNPKYQNTIETITMINSSQRQDIYTNSTKESLKLQKKTSSSTDFRLVLSEPLKNVFSIELMRITVPYTWYTFNYNYGNTCFWIKNPGGDWVNISIKSGNYTEQELATEISNNSLGYFESINYLPNTGKFEFTRAGGATDTSMLFFSFDDSWNCIDASICQMKSQTKSNQNLGWNMGFKPPPDASGLVIQSETTNVFESPNVVNVSSTDNLLLLINDYNKNVNSRGLVTIKNARDSNNSDTLTLPNYYFENERIKQNDCNYAGQAKAHYVVPSNPRKLTLTQLYSINEIIASKTTKFSRAETPTAVDFLDSIQINTDNIVTNQKISKNNTDRNKRTYFGPVDIERMEVKLTDDKGNVIDLNGADWSFTLKVEHLYEW